MTRQNSHWPCPLQPDQYNQRAELTLRELTILSSLSEALQKRHSKFPRRDPPELIWLFQPVRDVLSWMQTQVRLRNTALRFFIHEMARTQTSFWGWTDEDWIRFLGPREAPSRKDVNHHLMVVAFVLAGFSDFRKALAYRPELFAHRLFGAAGGEAQIGASVVEPVAVDVVDLQVRRGVHDEAVHLQGDAPAVDAHVVHGVAAVTETPAADLGEAGIVGVVHQRGRALGQGDGF